MDVNVLTVGGASTPVVSGTNAFSVAYARDANTILFANGEAPSSSHSPTFAVQIGGIYSIAADMRGPKSPAPLFTRRGAYHKRPHRFGLRGRGLRSAGRDGDVEGDPGSRQGVVAAAIDLVNRHPKRVDTGVDAIAWAP